MKCLNYNIKNRANKNNSKPFFDGDTFTNDAVGNADFVPYGTVPSDK